MKIQKYGKTQRLLGNQKYTVSFALNGESTSFTFTSRYSPLYSTVKIIRSDFPDLFSEISDDTINFLIWQNSLLATEVGDAENIVDGVPNYAIKQYVRFKTEYNIVRNVLIAIGAEAGSTEKHLGEFKITKEVKTPELKAILDALKAELKEWETASGKVLQNRGATRALTNAPFPLNERVSF